MNCRSGPEMDNDNSPENFAKHRRAVIVAPAGYGKTELIAQSVACSEGRQLILTHTHAGVDSIRKRIKEKYPVPTSRYYVETIHSFALRTAGSYPKTTGLTIQQPQTTDDYKQIIGSAIELFDTKLGKDILEASYSGIFVDEYQDCGIDQHELICKLAETLPCRVVGDPLQGIFDFGNNKIVDWEKHVFLFFERMPNLEIPYRWKYSIPELGERLKDIRTRLCDGKEIVFRKTVSSSYKEIVKFLNYEKFNGEKVFVICEPKNPDFPHVLAGSLKNRFRTIEPITCKTLIDYAFIIESCQELERLQSVLEFVNKCLKKISTESNEVLSTFIKAPINFRNDRKKKLKQL